MTVPLTDFILASLTKLISEAAVACGEGAQAQFKPTARHLDRGLRTWL